MSAAAASFDNLPAVAGVEHRGHFIVNERPHLAAERAAAFFADQEAGSAAPR